MWFVAASAGKARAWALMADPYGGERLPGELVANTLDELRAMLPLGLTRTDRSRSTVMARTCSRSGTKRSAQFGAATPKIVDGPQAPASNVLA